MRLLVEVDGQEVDWPMNNGLQQKILDLLTAPVEPVRKMKPYKRHDAGELPQIKKIGLRITKGGGG